MDASSIQAATNLVSLVLAIVALLVTTIGFFAALRFYRDGMELQAKVSSALARIEERAGAIHSQVGGIFDKTLDAALGRHDELEERFSDLNRQLDVSAAAIEQSVAQQLATLA